MVARRYGRIVSMSSVAGKAYLGEIALPTRRVVEVTPLRRLGEPSEVAVVCCYLTSPDAAFVTGQVVDVACGWLMT